MSETNLTDAIGDRIGDFAAAVTEDRSLWTREAQRAYADAILALIRERLMHADVLDKIALTWDEVMADRQANGADLMVATLEAAWSAITGETR